VKALRFDIVLALPSRCSSVFVGVRCLVSAWTPFGYFENGKLEYILFLEYHWSKGQPIPWHLRCSASAMAFLACAATLLTDRFVGTNFCQQCQHSTSRSSTRTKPPIHPRPQPASRNARPTNPPTTTTSLELPYHVREAFRKLLHTPHAPFTRQDGGLLEAGIGQKEKLVCNPGCFSLAASVCLSACCNLQELQLQGRCRHITWYKIQSREPAAAVERGQAFGLVCRYCWEPTPTPPSKELSMYDDNLFDTEIDLFRMNES
jgi:hypothetical protein